VIDPRLLDILVCPKCKGPLDHSEKEGRLLCPECRLAYPIKENIPVMLIDEAENY
jgi:uncharacterized protein YbaR (Trm112 family)